MTAWHDRRILDLFGIELPIIQAPMAGSTTVDMVIATCRAGGLGSLPSAQYSVEQLREALRRINEETAAPINVNFFSHTTPADDPAAQMKWRSALAPYYRELGLDPAVPVSGSGRAPFDDAFCDVVEEFRPAVVSFHFGLPEPRLVERVRATGAKIISSATIVEEAVWLEDNGVDAVIAMGLEAGGHRGNFLTTDMSTQVGTMALVPQVVDAVRVPVIAAGGIADGRGVAAALMLGASAVQIGTAYLFSPEAKIPAVHAAALGHAGDASTAITNLFTGRPHAASSTGSCANSGRFPISRRHFRRQGRPLRPSGRRRRAKGATTSRTCGRDSRQGSRNICRPASSRDHSSTTPSQS